VNHLLYKKALELRLKGYSYNEINNEIGVAKSTLSSWFSKIILSGEAMARLSSRVARGTLNGLVRRNKQQTLLAKERSLQIRSQAKSEVKAISRNDLLLIGTVLYWAEGYKKLKQVNGREITAHSVSLTNSDPEIVSCFVIFLREILGVSMDNIVIEMRLFKHMDAENSIRYWMRVTGLPRNQFRKPLYPVSSASKGKRPINRLPYGTVQVIVSNTKLFYRVIGLIDGVKDRLQKLVKYMPR